MGYKLLGFLAPILLSVLITTSLDSSAQSVISDKSYDAINRSVYGIYFLIPFTDWSQLKPCGEFFDEHEEYEASLSCSNKELFAKAPYNKTITPVLPRCYVITTSSPDVHQTPLFNYVSLTMFTHDGIVGFYDDSDKTVYIVENTDAAMVYRHEVQHYFLDLVEGDGNGKHDHNIWKVCEPPYYEPSDEAYKKAGKEKPVKKVGMNTDSIYKTLKSLIIDIIPLIK